MKYRWDKKYLYWGVTAFLVILASLACVGILFRFSDLTGTFGFIINIFKPVLYGLVFAFLLNLIVRFAERAYAKIFRKKIAASANPIRWKKAGRAISIILACLLFMGILAGLLWMVIPQLVTSITGIFSNFQSYYDNLQNWLDSVLKNPDFAGSIGGAIEKGFTFVQNWIDTSLLPQAQNLLSGIASGALSTVMVLKDLIIGFIIAIYLLFSKEKFIAQAKKMLYAMVKKDRANRVVDTCQYANRVFRGFIGGQILDSLILGLLCFISVSIFLPFPFSLLISTIVCVTNVIPFFGPFIGGIPSAILILLIDPMKALYFIIIIVVLQQIDGNIIAPKIHGDMTGLSGFWIIFSITIFGGLFGIVGILVAVPAFAVLYTLIKRRIDRSLKRRKMSAETATYMETGCIYQSDPVEEIDDPNYPKPHLVTPEERAAAEAAMKSSQSSSRKKVSGWINRLRKKKK